MVRWRRKHPFVLPVASFLFFFCLLGVSFVNLGAQTIGAKNSRMVQVYVDGEERVVPTYAKTVREFLNRLAIEIREKDIVEPGLDAEITDDNFSINIYRARSVLVMDDNTQSIIVTAEPTPQGVAEKAGLTVYPEDKVTQVPADIVEPVDAAHRGIVAEKIIVDRATPVYLNLYGTPYTIRTHATTVEEVLAERGIKALEGDTVQPTPDTPA